ncbi:hypothetical protein PAPYR_11063 [Paratrimastix pyriformis]|uniref:Uncharacterized protein n=1 Tax=Paratrimastix pyriformis TaxID=342808 RepID=A0ABQ8U4J1_9EUKA|nr:hypothetical protein PAPYR_11063 [Paratrimastix pyriformis]
MMSEHHLENSISKIHTAGMDFSTPTNIAIPVLMMQIDEFHRKTLGMMSEHHLENSISIENPYRRYGFLVPTNIAIPVLMMQIDEFHRKTLGMMSEHHLEKFDFY